MTFFWLLAGALTLLVILAITPALIRPRLKNISSGDEPNVLIARERLKQLEAACQAGDLSKENYTSAELEVEQALAEELGEQATPVLHNRLGIQALAAVAILLPLASLGLYLLLGQPEWIENSGQVVQQQDQTLPPVTELVEQLAAKLEQHPDNADGWFLLGRTQMSLGRYADAVTSFRRVDALLPNTAPVLVSLADAIASANAGSLIGEPEQLVQRAVALDPINPIALWLAGNAREEAGDYSAAIDYWKKALPLLTDTPAAQQELRSRLRALTAKTGIPLQSDPPATPKEAGVTTVKVSLDTVLRDSVSPQDTVFVFARALNGSPMPLAVSRHRAAELPFAVRFSDLKVMIPSVRLSDYKEVSISAKLSKTGNAAPEVDDLISESQVAIPGSTSVIDLVIQSRRGGS